METYIIHPTKEQAKVVKAFLEALNVTFEKKQDKLPIHVTESVKKAQEEVDSGKTVSYEEFKRKLTVPE